MAIDRRSQSGGGGVALRLVESALTCWLLYRAMAQTFDNPL